MSFCLQLEQSQKEASDLLEQNRLLQDQLRVALGREQSAREGYVLQVGLRGCRAGGRGWGLGGEGRLVHLIMKRTAHFRMCLGQAWQG